MRISDWSSDVCSSDLAGGDRGRRRRAVRPHGRGLRRRHHGAHRGGGDPLRRQRLLAAALFAARTRRRREDRKSVVSGKSVSVSVDIGGRRIIKQKVNEITSVKRDTSKPKQDKH